jgi:hypothetical protein
MALGKEYKARSPSLLAGPAYPPKPRGNPAKRGNAIIQLIEQPGNGLDADPSLTPLACSATLTDRRKGISDVDPRSISGTIGETLPSLSPRAWAGFWLYDQLDTRVMGAGITARKKSHGGRCTPRDIGSGFNNQRTRRPEALFCKAGGGRVGLLAQRIRREGPSRLDRKRR